MSRQQQQRTLSLTPKQIELIERVVYDEARGEGVEGRNAVRAVIYNRIAANQRWFGGNTVEGVLNHRGQFQGVWEKGRGNAANLPLPDKVRETYKKEHLAFLESGVDPTNGATFFLNKGTARRPFNTNQQGLRIGNHEFFDNFNGNRVKVPNYEIALKGMPQDMTQAALNDPKPPAQPQAQPQPQMRPFTGRLQEFVDSINPFKSQPAQPQPERQIVRGTVTDSPEFLAEQQRLGQQSVQSNPTFRPFTGQLNNAFASGGMPTKREIEIDESENDMTCGMMKPDEFDMIVGTDPVSGNPIPPGSSAENVRDDIPAVLSDGEYVVPADVVRYHGLKTFMEMRAEAKMGLMAMMHEGQIRMISEEGEDEDTEDEEEEPDSAELVEPDVQAEEDSAEEGDEELSEDEYETPEGNVVEIAKPHIEVITMDVEEEEAEYGKDFYGDEEVIKIFIMDPQAFKRI